MKTLAIPLVLATVLMAKPLGPPVIPDVDPAGTTSAVAECSGDGCALPCAQAVSFGYSCAAGQWWVCPLAAYYIYQCASCGGGGGGDCLNPCPNGGSTEPSSYDCQNSGGWVVGTPDCTNGGCGNPATCVCCEWPKPQPIDASTVAGEGF